METWEYSFPPVSKEDWLKQVERDLKGRSIESLQQEWWPGESLDPFHYTDLVASPVILPGSLFANPPKLISFLGDEVDPIQANQRILSSLQCGTQSFHLYSHFNHKQVEQTLKDVIPGVVEWHLYETDTFLSFLKYEPQSFFRTTIDSALLSFCSQSSRIFIASSRSDLRSLSTRVMARPRAIRSPLIIRLNNSWVSLAMPYVETLSKYNFFINCILFTHNGLKC